MKTLDIKNKTRQQYHRQVRRWFNKKPNRKRVWLQKERTTKTFAIREDYVYPAQPPTQYRMDDTPVARVIADLI